MLGSGSEPQLPVSYTITRMNNQYSTVDGVTRRLCPTETRPRATPSAAAEQRRRAQLHAQGGPQRPGPLLPRRRRGTPHLNPTPQDAPLFSLRFPARRQPHRVFVGGQETAVGQRNGGAVGEHQDSRDSTLPTGTKGTGQSKSNLVYKPFFPPATPEATAESRPPSATYSVRRSRRSAASPERATEPADPRPQGATGPGTAGTKARGRRLGAAAGRRGKGRGERERKRSRYLALRYLAGSHSASTSSSLSGGAPGRGPSPGLRGSRRGYSAKAVPRLPADSAPRALVLPPRAAVKAPVRTRLRSTQRRREEPGHSPLARWRRGRPRGGGGDLAAWDSPLGARAGTGATASKPTHLWPPGAGFTAPSDSLT
ncbi:serine/arginine repetitive matrix protein 3-like [Pongo pygmaeus]|uniref:serine/arginine repetitive matrix protein 3-like n=1 Tax=Pongo pygmaeus TaxID=9600 RepID=UPI00300C3F74